MRPQHLINRKARAFYDVLETYEAGMVLTGSEVKSVRLGRVNFEGSYITFLDNRPYVVELNIDRYPKSAEKNYEPKRPRPLLLKSSEIDTLQGIQSRKGITLVPLRIYFRNNLAKLEIGVARGKKQADRREELKKKAVERDIAVAERGKS